MEKTKCSFKDNLIVTSNNNNNNNNNNKKKKKKNKDIAIKIFDVKLLDAEGPNSVFAIAAYRCQNGNIATKLKVLNCIDPGASPSRN